MSSAAASSPRGFPPEFVWGTATSAFQIEGSPAADGKGPSIWDEFCRRPGAIRDRTNADAACDHYRRMPEDVDLLASLGVKAYRFSISWPRLFPEGRGTLNSAGLDFYRRLTDALLSRGIEPWATLYHWDLPAALEREGGWGKRRTAEYFAEYAHAAARALGDRVRYWMPVNEPGVVMALGYVLGGHAPGRRSPVLALKVMHHLLLAHGLATQAVRAAAPSVRVGPVINFSPVYDRTGRRFVSRGWRHALANRLFLDPVGRGRYPLGLGIPLRAMGCCRPGDMQVIAQPLDFIGVNYYSRQQGWGRRPGPRTAMGWEIFPQGLYDLLCWLHQALPALPLVVTENGAAFDDQVENSAVHDPERREYLRAHLQSVRQALDRGVPVQGYFCWSFLDNFEWAEGLSRRFGLVYVDYADQRRIVKDSGRWFGRVCREGLIPDESGEPA